MKKIIIITLLLLAHTSFAKVEEAIFAGGNFWTMEAEFNNVRGVLGTINGFDGGTSKNPTYTQVNKGITDYVQAIRVIYDPETINYQQIVDYFWQHIDPTVEDRQFCNVGPQFGTAIFYLNEKQKAIALASKQTLEKKFPKIYTRVLPSTQFYAASGAQQDYFQKHPFRYRYYKYRCGQEARLEELWQSTQ